MSSLLPDAVPLAEVRRALVTKLRHHGDVLLASPVFTALKRAAPHAEIDALVYRETAPMLEGHPSIARVHTIDREWKRQGARRQLAAEWALVRALRERRFDLLVHLTEHPRGLTLAQILRPRYAVTRARRPGAGLAARIHAFLQGAGAYAAPHGRDEPRCASADRHPARIGGSRARARVRRRRAGAHGCAAGATRCRERAVRAGAPGLALAFQVLAGRANGRADFKHSGKHGFMENPQHRDSPGSPGVVSNLVRPKPS